MVDEALNIPHSRRQVTGIHPPRKRGDSTGFKMHIIQRRRQNKLNRRRCIKRKGNPDTAYFVTRLKNVASAFPRPQYIAHAVRMPRFHVIIHTKDFAFGRRAPSFSGNQYSAKMFFPILAGILLKSLLFKKHTILLFSILQHSFHLQQMTILSLNSEY